MFFFLQEKKKITYGVDFTDRNINFFGILEL